MKKLLAILASLAICCTALAACGNGDTSSKSDTSSTADSSTADTSSEADTSEADSLAADTSAVTSSEPDSSATESFEPEEPFDSEAPLGETVIEPTTIDIAPFEAFYEISDAPQHTITANIEFFLYGSTLTSYLTEVRSDDNAYIGETSELYGNTETNDYLFLDGKAYFIDRNKSAYYEDPRYGSIDDILYFEGLSEILKEAADNDAFTDISTITLKDEEYVRYRFVYEGQDIYFYTKDSAPAIITVTSSSQLMTVTLDKTEATADQDLLKIPDGFKQVTEDEYHDL